MNLSIEAKVAAVIAVGFAALTIGAIAQGDHADQPGRPSGSDPIKPPAINTQIRHQVNNNSQPGLR